MHPRIRDLFRATLCCLCLSPTVAAQSGVGLGSAGGAVVPSANPKDLLDGCLYSATQNGFVCMSSVIGGTSDSHDWTLWLQQPGQKTKLLHTIGSCDPGGCVTEKRKFPSGAENRMLARWFRKHRAELAAMKLQPTTTVKSDGTACSVVSGGTRITVSRRGSSAAVRWDAGPMKGQSVNGPAPLLDDPACQQVDGLAACAVNASHDSVLLIWLMSVDFDKEDCTGPDLGWPQFSAVKVRSR